MQQAEAAPGYRERHLIAAAPGPARSLLIGDLGPDQPFALDHRPTGPPRVVYLRCDDQPRWVTVAPTIESLLDALGPGGRS